MLQRRLYRLMTAAALALVMALPVSAPSALAEETGDETAADDSLNPASIGSFAGAFLAARVADFDADTDAAIAFYKRALAFDPENATLKQRLMVALFTDGRFQDGLAIAEELKDDQSIERVTDLARAIEAMRQREYRKVETLIAYDGPNELDQLLSGLMTAWALYGQDKVDEALTRIDGMQGSEWFAVFLNFHGGSIAAAAGDHDEARQRFTAAISDQVGGGAAPDTYMRAVMALATMEARTGNRQAALDAVSTGEAFAPTYAPLMALRQQIEAGETPEIDIATAQEGAAAVLHTIAAALNREGAEEVVSLYLQFARVLDPENAATLVLLGGLAEDLDKPEKAIAIYKGVPGNSPMRRVAQLQLGLNLADLGRTEEAKKHLTALIEADPNDMRSYLAYGSVLSNAKQYEEMAENYDRAVAAIDGEPDTQHWNIFFQRGIAYERLKEWEKAEPNFLTALELSPDQPQVLNYLGYSWVDMNMNLDRGMEMIEKAVELRPNDGYIVDSLGWAHYRLGDYAAAVKELERAAELRPGDSTINDHLGDAYWRVGRKLEAVYQWNRALTLDPDEEFIPDIRAKIENGLPVQDDPATAEDRGDDTEHQRPAIDPDERSQFLELHKAFRRLATLN